MRKALRAHRERAEPQSAAMSSPDFSPRALRIAATRERIDSRIDPPIPTHMRYAAWSTAGGGAVWRRVTCPKKWANVRTTSINDCLSRQKDWVSPWLISGDTLR